MQKRLNFYEKCSKCLGIFIPSGQLTLFSSLFLSGKESGTDEDFRVVRRSIVFSFAPDS